MYLCIFTYIHTLIDIQTYHICICIYNIVSSFGLCPCNKIVFCCQYASPIFVAFCCYLSLLTPYTLYFCYYFIVQLLLSTYLLDTFPYSLLPQSLVFACLLFCGYIFVCPRVLCIHSIYITITMSAQIDRWCMRKHKVQIY